MLEARLNAYSKFKEQAVSKVDKLKKWSDTLVKKQLDLQKLELRLNELDEAIVSKQAQENEVRNFQASFFLLNYKNIFLLILRFRFLSSALVRM